jgi:hypothetical protein
LCLPRCGLFSSDRGFERLIRAEQLPLDLGPILFAHPLLARVATGMASAGSKPRRSAAHGQRA